MLLFSERISGIIVAGGYGKYVDFLSGDLEIKQLPNLPQEIYDSSIVAHNGTILLCRGFENEEKCLQLDLGTWKDHSTLNEERVMPSAVTTQKATFIFGGNYSRKTYEYLPKHSTTWLMGKTEIPGGFEDGCAIAVKSDQEILLIGGHKTERRILSFSVNDHTFKELPLRLIASRERHGCAFIPNTNKIMITGGYGKYDRLDFVEVIDAEDGSVTMASPMNFKRDSHGMGVITINGKDRLVVFGGYDGKNLLDSVELYNTQTEQWEISDFKLSRAKFGFSLLSVKLGDIISFLQCQKT